MAAAIRFWGSFVAQSYFFSFDGVDGVGKSTQHALFCEWLREQGHDVVACRDPGSTQLGEAIRHILLQDHGTPIHRRSEMLLYMAARAQLVEEVIRPALAASKTVVSDRFLLANVVYQSVGGNVPAARLWEMGDWANDGMSPDLTLLLDMPATAAMDRIAGTTDRMERRGTAYMESVREAFLNELPKSSRSTAIINADRDADAVARDIAQVVDQFLMDASSPAIA